jgi:ubiquinone/menaquinone biosynthesis C-methylase UbiE/uncharacterized protein YbaR (Trm112 family)
MIFQGIEICCPACRRDLQSSGNLLRCVSCQRQFPIIAGIPDLRLFADPYIDMDADRAKGMKVAEQAEKGSFADLLDFYYGITDVVPPEHARLYKRGLMAAADRARDALNAWEPPESTTPDTDLLEVGCGTGPLLLAARKRYRRVVGVDIAFRWLCVARKRLEEAGVTDIPLICACAEALPFPHPMFDRAVFDSSLEVVENQQTTLREARRVLRPRARVFISTPNRFSLGPDPHIGVLAGGWWPKRWLDAWAVKHNAVPPKRKLLSARSLGRLLEGAGFNQVRISIPKISQAQRSRLPGSLQWMIDGYHVAAKLPITRQMLMGIGPLLEASAVREGSAR